MSATHQILDKLVTETQETMSLRQGCETNLTRLLGDAENCKQLLPKLQDAVRCDPHHIEVRLSKLKAELHSAIKLYLKVNITILSTIITIIMHSINFRKQWKPCYERVLNSVP